LCVCVSVFGPLLGTMEEGSPSVEGDSPSGLSDGMAAADLYEQAHTHTFLSTVKFSNINNTHTHIRIYHTYTTGGKSGIRSGPREKGS